MSINRANTKHLHYYVFLLVLTASVLFGIGPALADDRAEAKRHFEAGLALQKSDQLQAAAAEYEESVRLYATRGGLYNLANTLKSLQRYGDALETFARLKKEFSHQLDPEMAADVEKEITTIHSLVARLTIQVDRAGARVLIDGKEWGETPVFKQAILLPGTHTVEIELTGFAPEKRALSLAAGTTGNIDFRLQETEEPIPGPAPSVADRGEKTTELDRTAPGSKKLMGTLGWVFTSVGAAVLAGGVATGIMAKQKQGELDDICEGFACRDRSYVGIQDSRDQLALTTDILLPTGGILVTAGVLLVILANRKRERPAAESVVRLAPWVEGGTMGVSYTTKF